MNLRFPIALLSTTIKTSTALRGAFLLQASFMLLNNLIFFTTWWILFQRFPDVRGWVLADMMALFGMVATGFGFAVIVCGGAIDMARMIADGDLDALLTQPKSVLLRAIASRSDATGWGDVASGLALIALSGYWHGAATPFILLAVALTSVAFVASWVVLGSAALWLGRVESVTRMFVEFVISFSSYPPPLFGSMLKVVLFTIVPAGIVAYLPVELIRNARWDSALLAVSTVTAYALFALWLFERGLRRYESGNRFGVWG